MKSYLQQGQRKFLILFACLSISFPLQADEPATKSAKKLVFSSDPIGIDVILQLVLSMVLVIGVIVLFAWLMRRATGFRAQAGSSLQVLGGLSVGTREKIVLVKVGETQLLLGVAPGQVRKLHELKTPVKRNDDSHNDVTNNESKGHGKEAIRFSDRLKTAIGKGSVE